MKRMTISVVRKFKTFLFFEASLLVLLFFGKDLFINAEVAFLGSFLIIVASGFAHKRMVQRGVQSGIYEQERDLLEAIDDPHGLFEERAEEAIPEEQIDLKSVVQEEKRRIRPFSAGSLRHGLRGSLTLYRIAAYLFLVLGFIALKNNQILNVGVYLSALMPGIVAGYLFLKE